MDRNFAVTVFTLLFAVTTARISLDPKPSELPVFVPSNCNHNNDVKHLSQYTASDSSNLVLQKEMKSTGSAELELLSDSVDPSQVRKVVKDRMFKVDLTPRSDYARFHAINRRFFDHHRNPNLRYDHPRPYRHVRNPFANPLPETSHKNEDILSTETGKLDAENPHGRSFSTRMKFKQPFKQLKHDNKRYEHHHRHHHLHHNNKDMSTLRRKFGMEKVKNVNVNVVNEDKEKTKASLIMKSIRKFLKHSFD